MQQQPQSSTMIYPSPQQQDPYMNMYQQYPGMMQGGHDMQQMQNPQPYNYSMYRGQGMPQDSNLPQYDLYQLNNLFSSGMGNQDFNRNIHQLQHQWLQTQGNLVNGQLYSPYQSTFNIQGANGRHQQYTYPQNGNYSLSPEQLGRLYQQGQITGIDPKTGRTLGGFNTNAGPIRRSAGSSIYL